MKIASNNRRVKGVGVTENTNKYLRELHTLLIANPGDLAVYVRLEIKFYWLA